jgi:hypothetical protein
MAYSDSTGVVISKYFQRKEAKGSEGSRRRNLLRATLRAPWLCGEIKLSRLESVFTAKPR